MDKGAKAWLYKTARKNLWRMPEWYELDDLVQDGYMAYAYVKKKYPQATHPSHIMRLFQITYHCRITDLSNRKRKQIDAPLNIPAFATPDFEEAAWDQVMNASGMVDKQPELADPIVAKVLATLQTMDGRKMRAPSRPRANGTRETFNEKLCRWVGVSPADFDLRGMLEDYLTARA